MIIKEVSEDIANRIVARDRIVLSKLYLDGAYEVDRVFSYQLLDTMSAGLSIEEVRQATNYENMHGWLLHIWLEGEEVSEEEFKKIFDAALDMYDVIGISYSHTSPRKYADENIYVDL